MVQEERPDGPDQPGGAHPEDLGAFRSVEAGARARDLIHAGLARGFPAAEAYVKQSRVRRLECSGSGTAEESSGWETGTALRFFPACGSPVFAASNGRLPPDPGLDQPAPRPLTAGADNVCPELPARLPAAPADLQIYDEALACLSDDERRAFLERLRGAALRLSRHIRVDRLSFEDVVLEHHIANSAGLCASYRETLCCVSLSLYAEKNGSLVPSSALFNARSLKALDPERLGAETALRSLLPLGGRSVPSGRYDALIHGSVALHLVRAFADRCLSAWDSPGRPAASWLAESLGTRTVLIDDGTLPGGLSTSPFDGDGSQRQKTIVVEKGRACDRLHDVLTARAASSRSTGNSIRTSYARPPALGVSNFFLKPGRRSVEDLLQEIPRGLYIYNCLAPITGAEEKPGWFSIPVSGALIRSGRLSDPLGGVAIKAPVNELFRSIREGASDLVFLPGRGACGAPSLLVEGLTVEEI